MKTAPQAEPEVVYGLKTIGEHLGRVGEAAVRSYAARDAKDDPLELFVDHIGIGILLADLKAWKGRQRVPYKTALKTGKGRVVRRPRS